MVHHRTSQPSLRDEILCMDTYRVLKHPATFNGRSATADSGSATVAAEQLGQAAVSLGWQGEMALVCRCPDFAQAAGGEVAEMSNEGAAERGRERGGFGGEVARDQVGDPELDRLGRGETG